MWVEGPHRRTADAQDAQDAAAWVEGPHRRTANGWDDMGHCQKQTGQRMALDDVGYRQRNPGQLEERGSKDLAEELQMAGLTWGNVRGT